MKYKFKAGDMIDGKFGNKYYRGLVVDVGNRNNRLSEYKVYWLTHRCQRYEQKVGIFTKDFVEELNKIVAK